MPEKDLPAERAHRQQKATQYIQTVRNHLLPTRPQTWQTFLTILVTFRRSLKADRSAHKDLVEAAHLQILMLFRDEGDRGLVDGFRWFLPSPTALGERGEEGGEGDKGGEKREGENRESDKGGEIREGMREEDKRGEGEGEGEREKGVVELAAGLVGSLI